jgi:hypothetical protein
MTATLDHLNRNPRRGRYLTPIVATIVGLDTLTRLMHLATYSTHTSNHTITTAVAINIIIVITEWCAAWRIYLDSCPTTDLTAARTARRRKGTR